MLLEDSTDISSTSFGIVTFNILTRHWHRRWECWWDLLWTVSWEALWTRRWIYPAGRNTGFLMMKQTGMEWNLSKAHTFRALCLALCCMLSGISKKGGRSHAVFMIIDRAADRRKEILGAIPGGTQKAIAHIWHVLYELSKTGIKPGTDAVKD